MAAINKSFVIKNGLEVNTNLIFADAPEGKVGIGTTNPEYLLHVKGGIGATDSFVSGISTTGVLHVGTAGTVITTTAAGSVGLGITNPQYKLHVIGGIGVTDSFVTGVSTVLTTLRVGTGGTVLTVLGVGNSIGVGTASPQYLFHINSPVSTGQTALYVQGDVRITGDLSVDDITFDDATLSNLTVTEALNVTSPGISTFGGYVDINSNVDISGTLNVSGISSFVGLATFGNGLRVVSGVTTLGVTTATNITAQNLYVSGIGTIINGTITNLTGTSGTITTLSSTNGTITNLTGTAATITTFNSTNSTITNLNVTGIGTIATLNATGIGVTNFTVYNALSVGGISTFTNGPVLIGSGTSTGTASQRLQVTGGTYVSGNLGIGSTNPTSALFVVGDARVTGVITATTFSGNVNAGVGTITNLTGTNVSYSGISTLGTVRVSSGIITATSGIVTYFGDGNFLNLTSNPSRGIGIGTTGGVVGYAVTFINFKGSGVSTAQYNSSTGIATIFFEGGGGGSGSIGIGSTFSAGAANGDLFFHIDYGRIFVYYDEVTLGIGTDEYWIDAAPFNVGIITALSNVSFSPGSAVAPSMFFVGDQQTGFFSPGNGQFTVVSSGSSVLNVNASGINITGITTFTNASGTVKIGIGTTALLVEGNARVTGILTVGSSSITLNGTTNIINVGTGITLSSSGINVTGVITATSFVGNGSGLTGAGSTVFIDTTTNQEFFPLFTATTSGTITASGISTSKLTYNPSTGTVTAVDFNSTSDINLKENIHTVGNALEITEQLRGVSFDWKETGRSSYGVIAQELEAVLPELVKQGEVKSVNYNGIIGVLIEAIKELKKEIEDLKNTK